MSGYQEQADFDAASGADEEERERRMDDDMTPAEKMVAYLHEKAGLCGHCGKRKCLGRRAQSLLPEKIKTDVVLAAIKHATGEEP